MMTDIYLMKQKNIYVQQSGQRDALRPFTVAAGNKRPATQKKKNLIPAKSQLLNDTHRSTYLSIFRFRSAGSPSPSPFSSTIHLQCWQAFSPRPTAPWPLVWMTVSRGIGATQRHAVWDCSSAFRWTTSLCSLWLLLWHEKLVKLALREDFFYACLRRVLFPSSFSTFHPCRNVLNKPIAIV